MKFNRYLFISLFALLGLTSSCVDDYFDIDPEVGEGEADVTAKVVFSPVLNALGENTRAAGDALKHINSLLVVVYDKDNKFVEKHLVWNNSQSQGNYGCTVENNNNDTDVPPAAETKTPVAKFTIPGLQFGKYHIYAVANMGDLSDPEYTQYNLFEKGVSTPDGLKDIVLTWNNNPNDVSKNDQMFGYFTPDGANKSQGFEAPELLVNRSLQKIHAWVKRAASKVTVNVDGSQLNEGVQVWIKSIQVKDIPQYCYLGKNHTSSSSTLITEGEKIIVSSETGENGLFVSKAHPNLYDPQQVHSETAQALYFYENMQGKGQSKKQAWTEGATKPEFPDGNTPGTQGFKDSKPNGTYVEVIGFYRNASGSGPIIYRFMLGKDVDKDYNVERNYHYKLTLNLKNNANDNDWHIVYDPEPEIIAPDPYYISYLYDETMTMPIKVMGAEILSFRAEITENGWHAIGVPEDAQPFPYWQGTPNNNGVWNGFLSLRKTSTARVEAPGGTDALTYNKTYWEQNQRGNRIYIPEESQAIQDRDGHYSFTTNGGSEWIANIPFYTRAKQLVPTTGYTGNNPYVAYRRQAKVKFTAQVRKYGATDPVEVTKEVTIYQMRRVVNPKGIWRSAGCDNEFHVVLMILPYENATKFEALKSEGPWRAEIEKGDWFTLTPTPGQSVKDPNGNITGEDKSRIDFTYKPNGTIGANETRFGIIKIYYNNYSCVHRIFVRQGYAPVEYPGTGVRWHSFNLYSRNEEASDPAEEGSYFKYNNLDNPIAAENNIAIAAKYPNGSIPEGSESSNNNLNYNFIIVGKNISTWQNIESYNPQWNIASGSQESTLGRVAKQSEFAKITSNENTIFGYGVIYTDNTTVTQTDTKNVYGYDRSNRTNRGMRGVFVCDSETGINLFFPIGASGYGRIKRMGDNTIYRQARGYAGVVQYSNRWKYYPSSGDAIVNDRPLFWDLYRRPGANYWMNPNVGNNEAKTAYRLDINYYTFDFNTELGDGAEVYNFNNNTVTVNNREYTVGSDALFIRLVDK